MAGSVSSRPQSRPQPSPIYSIDLKGHVRHHHQHPGPRASPIPCQFDEKSANPRTISPQIFRHRSPSSQPSQTTHVDVSNVSNVCGPRPSQNGATRHKKQRPRVRTSKNFGKMSPESAYNRKLRQNVARGCVQQKTSSNVASWVLHNKNCQSRPDKPVDEKKTSRDGGGSDLVEVSQADPGV